MKTLLGVLLVGLITFGLVGVTSAEGKPFRVHGYVQWIGGMLAGLYRSGDVVAIYERWFGTFGTPSQALKFMYLINGLPE